ncbi:MAG TPA: DUF1835 domain-containing protein [Steroidobacteraceae bacterium]|jgi:hypothetical protein
MAGRTERTPSAFRLNLEQQKKRAKDLLRAAKTGDATALSRFAAAHRAHQMSDGVKALKLADAQFVIAHELRFSSWTALNAHIASMERQRLTIDTDRAAPDGDMKTLHIRCGSDIQKTLQDAGFVGDFLEHAIPYCMGPVTTGPDRHELMARFLVDAFPEAMGGLIYERELEKLVRGEERLARTGDEYERIVLWAEHDVWDQLFLARMLAHHAQAKRPRVLELISVNEFPGGERFIGLDATQGSRLRGLCGARSGVPCLRNTRPGANKALIAALGEPYPYLLPDSASHAPGTWRVEICSYANLRIPLRSQRKDRRGSPQDVRTDQYLGRAVQSSRYLSRPDEPGRACSKTDFRQLHRHRFRPERTGMRCARLRQRSVWQRHVCVRLSPLFERRASAAPQS